MPCRRYVVQGLVQGVFYRASAQQTALALGLTGWVRNLTDGSVELLACGAPDRLEQLERWLRRGPSRARVDQVVVTETDAQTFSGFEVTR